jgi:hypothetical protein
MKNERLTCFVTNLDNLTQAWHLDISQSKTVILSDDRTSSQPKLFVNFRGTDVAMSNRSPTSIWATQHLLRIST